MITENSFYTDIVNKEISLNDILIHTVTERYIENGNIKPHKDFSLIVPDNVKIIRYNEDSKLIFKETGKYHIRFISKRYDRKDICIKVYINNI